MFLLLLPIAFGVLAGLARGGSTAGWERVRVAWWPVALVSLAVQLALHNPPIDRLQWALEWGPLIWLLALTAIFLVATRNAVSKGQARGAWRLAALGVALNLLVALANGGYMPQSTEARALAGRPSAPVGELHNVAAAADGARLPWLGDVIPEPAWVPAANVLSVGDVLLSLGLGWWALYVTLANRRMAGQAGRGGAA